MTRAWGGKHAAYLVLFLSNIKKFKPAGAISSFVELSTLTTRGLLSLVLTDLLINQQSRFSLTARILLKIRSLLSFKTPKEFTYKKKTYAHTSCGHVYNDRPCSGLRPRRFGSAASGIGSTR